MKAEVNEVDVELLLKILHTMYDWSGVSDDTPDEFEVMADSNQLNPITLGDIRDASTLLARVKNDILSKSK